MPKKIEPFIIKNEKILIFEPHPDDVAFQLMGSVIKWLDDRKEIMICTITNGNNSTFDKKITAEEIAKIMFQEHKNVMNKIGIDDDHLIMLNYNDLGLDPGTDRKKLLTDMVRIIRTFKPTTVITMDPKNIENEENADHRIVAMTGFEAAALAAYPNVLVEQFKEKGVDQHFVARCLFYMTPEPNAFVDINGEPLEKKKEIGAIYKSQLELMIGEIDMRLRQMGLDPEINQISQDDLWKSVCESMAKETAQQAAIFFKNHPELAPRVKLEYAEGFRIYYLGAVEKLREYLPRECLTL